MTFEQVANPNLGPSAQRPNLLTNGGFEIWQRGNGPFTANGVYTADRWRTSIIGTDTISVSASSTSLDAGSSVQAAVTFTLGTGGGGTILHQYLVETTYTYQLGGKTLTLSMRVRCSAANAVRLGIYNSTAWTYGAYHSGSGNFETLSVSVAVPVAPSQIWAGASFAASCTAYLDNAMLVVGSTPADYVPMHPADDLARCLRYYEKQQLRAAQYGVAGSQLEWWQSFKAVKAVSPTITLADTGSTNIGTINSAFTNTVGTDLYGLTTAVGTSALYTTWTAEANP